MDSMEIVAKKNLGSNMVEYRVCNKGQNYYYDCINLSSSDNSFQIYDRVKLTNKDN